MHCSAVFSHTPRLVHGRRTLAKDKRHLLAGVVSANAYVYCVIGKRQGQKEEAAGFGCT